MKPTIGRIVHYGIGRDHAGEVVRRPALIVNDWGGAAEDVDAHPNIKVELDFSNDAPGMHRYASDSEKSYGPSAEECERGVAWRTSVDFGEGVGEWCWPPRS